MMACSSLPACDPRVVKPVSPSGATSVASNGSSALRNQNWFSLKGFVSHKSEKSSIVSDEDDSLASSLPRDSINA